MRRGEVWWASLPEPLGSEPGFRRPLLIVQSDDFNRSHIRTVVAVVITSNLRLASAPGNVLLLAKETKLTNFPRIRSYGSSHSTMAGSRLSSTRSGL